MAGERISVGLGETLFPFKNAASQVDLVIIRGRPGLPINFRIQPIFDTSSAGYFVCEGAELLNPLAVTIKHQGNRLKAAELLEGLSHTFIDPTSRLDLSVNLPDSPTLTAKVRQRYFKIRELRFWYYDPSVTLPRIKTRGFLTSTPLPALVTPLVLGNDLYGAGEPFGGKLLVSNDPDFLSEIAVVFTLPDPEIKQAVLEAEKQIWEANWNGFDWGVLYGGNSQGELRRLYGLFSDPRRIPPDQAELILSRVGRDRFHRTTEEFIGQALVMQSAAQRWVEKRIVQLDKIWRDQEKHFRM